MIFCWFRKKIFKRSKRNRNLYINSKIKKIISPFIYDIKNAYLKKNKIFVNKKNPIFEVFEYSPALKLGLSNAIKYVNNKGIEKIEKNIKKLSSFFLSEMKSLIKFFL